MTTFVPEDLRVAVSEYIADHRGDLIELLRNMIRTRSVNPAFDPDSPGEDAMARLVCNRYEALAIPFETIEAVPGRPNVIARWDGTEGRPRLLVNCHLDTHAPDLGEWVDPFTGKTVREWTHDPFGAEVKDGKIYGRGAADHKSPIAAILLAVEALKANNVRLRGTLTCIHDADEETGGKYGMRHLASTLPFDHDMALYACTSEITPRGRQYFAPMGDSNVVRAFSGNQTYRIRVVGRNLHSMTPKRGLGAAEAALLFLDRVRPLQERVNTQPGSVEANGHARMRVTAIESSPRASLHHHALSCDIIINRRMIPGADPSDAIAELQAIVDAHNEAYPENGADMEVVRSLPSFEVPTDHPLVRGLVSAIQSVTGEDPAIVGLPASVGISELLVDHPIPTVLFGYGTVNLHHAVDEHIGVDALVKMAQVYAVALMEWLGVAE